MKLDPKTQKILDESKKLRTEGKKIREEFLYKINNQRLFCQEIELSLNKINKSLSEFQTELQEIKDEVQEEYKKLLKEGIYVANNTFYIVENHKVYQILDSFNKYQKMEINRLPSKAVEVTEKLSIKVIERIFNSTNIQEKTNDKNSN